MPLDPPTLRPITGEPQSPVWPCKRPKLDDDGAAHDLNCTTARQRPASPPPTLHAEGQPATTTAAAAANGLPEAGSPQRATTAGVGRRTSVLFKKAKNGAKLFRERDGPLPNGKAPQGDAPGSTASTPSSTPLSTPTKTPQKIPTPPPLDAKWTPSKDLSSDPEPETPNKTLESGEKFVCLFVYLT